MGKEESFLKEETDAISAGRSSYAQKENGKNEPRFDLRQNRLVWIVAVMATRRRMVQCSISEFAAIYAQ